MAEKLTLRQKIDKQAQAKIAKMSRNSRVFLAVIYGLVVISSIQKGLSGVVLLALLTPLFYGVYWLVTKKHNRLKAEYTEYLENNMLLSYFHLVKKMDIKKADAARKTISVKDRDLILTTVTDEISTEMAKLAKSMPKAAKKKGVLLQDPTEDITPDEMKPFFDISNGVSKTGMPLSAGGIAADGSTIGYDPLND